jgi:general secretion pathway protein H
MRSKGFTLVEILVVVVIMAFVISVAVLSVGTTGRDSQLDEESRRLDGLIGLLHDRAALEGRDFGLRIEPSEYEFLSYDTDHDRWVPLSRDGEFRRRTLPKGVSFQLELDSQQVVLKPIDTSLSSAADQPRPQIAIAASGEGTPFRLTLVREGSSVKASVGGDALGKLTLATSDQKGKHS